MIENDGQLAQAREALAGLESALRALRVRIGDSNPALFAAIAEDYYDSIQEMRADIDAYLGVEHLLQATTPFWMVLEGEQVSRSEISSRLLSEWLERLRKSLYGVAAYLRDRTVRLGGRPEATLLRLTDPKVVALQPGSIRVGLKLPSEEPQGELLNGDEPDQDALSERALQRLMEVAAWANSDKHDGSLPAGADGDEVSVVARYAAMLAPTPRSPVRTVLFTGSLIPDGEPLRLSAETRVRLEGLVQVLAKVSEEEVIGHVREIDLDARRLTLRERGPELPDLKCMVPEELMAVAEKLLDRTVRIRGLIASSVPDTLHVLSIDHEGAA